MPQRAAAAGGSGSGVSIVGEERGRERGQDEFSMTTIWQLEAQGRQAVMRAGMDVLLLCKSFAAVLVRPAPTCAVSPRMVSQHAPSPAEHTGSAHRRGRECAITSCTAL